MNTKRRNTSNNNSNAIKDFAIEDLWIALNPRVDKLARLLDEGMEATDKDGNPDWNSRFKFIQLVMAYGMGKPREVMQVETSGAQGIFIGNLKGESDEQDSREDVQS